MSTYLDQFYPFDVGLYQFYPFDVNLNNFYFSFLTRRTENIPNFTGRTNSNFNL